MEINNKDLQANDPVKKQPTVSDKDMGEGLSPMSPPEGLEAPSEVLVAYEDLHPFLQELCDEHKALKSRIADLRKVISQIKSKRETDKKDIKDVSDFLIFFHDIFIPHNRKEESQLFKLLNQKLLETGEHSAGTDKFTGIRVLEDDHVQAIRQGAVLSHLVKLIFSISDIKSHVIVRNSFTEQADELCELLELHIYREDNIVFGQAQNLLSNEELDLISAEFNA